MSTPVAAVSYALQEGTSRLTCRSQRLRSQLARVTTVANDTLEQPGEEMADALTRAGVARILQEDE